MRAHMYYRWSFKWLECSRLTSRWRRMTRWWQYCTSHVTLLYDDRLGLRCMSTRMHWCESMQTWLTSWSIATMHWGKKCAPAANWVHGCCKCIVPGCGSLCLSLLRHFVWASINLRRVQIVTVVRSSVFQSPTQYQRLLSSSSSTGAYQDGLCTWGLSL